MAVINTQYSTLEEAWGTAGKLKKRVKERECNLYEARTKPKQKPYRNNTSRDLKEHQNMMLMDEDKDNEEYEKYYGYSDARTYSRTNRPINGHKEYFKPKSKKHVSINPEVNKYYYTDDPMDYIQDHNPSSKKVFEEDQDEIEEEIEEEAYLQNSPKSSEYIYEEVYDEDDDNYLTQNTKSDEESRRANINKYIDEEIENEIVQLPKRNISRNSPTTDVNRQVLDLSIYTLSGIILIFMMEQFVQIGVKIKTYT
jgi:hypothetical protein